jgi:probable rRNA maturation factor
MRNGMSEYQVEIQIDPAYTGDVAESWVARVAHSTLEAEAVVSAALSVVITDDDEVHELNRTYRQVDRPTDVLAFAAYEGDPFVEPEEATPYLGDVIISYPRAAEQAVSHGHSVRQELALLIVHGTLHLLGYDHAQEEETRRMWARQEAILDGVT